MDPENPYAAPRHSTDMGPVVRVPTTSLEILLAGFSLYANNLMAVVGVTLAVWVPLELAQSYYDYFVANQEDLWGSFRMTIWIENLIGIIPIAGTIAIGNAAMKGERPTIWFGLRSGLEAWPRMFGSRLVVSVLTILAAFLFVIPGIFVGVRSALAEQAAVIERLNGMASMKRSFELTEGSFWRYFLLSSVALGAVFLLGAMTAIPGTIYPEIDHWLLSAGLSVLVDLAGAWSAIVFVAAYWASVHSRSQAAAVTSSHNWPPAS